MTLRRLRLPALLLALLLVAAACGGDGSDDESSSGSSTTSTADAGGDGDSGGTGDSDDAGGAGGGSGDPGDGGTTGTTAGGSGGGTGGATTTTAGGSGGGSGGAGGRADDGVARPAAPGTYTYDTDGQSTTGGGDPEPLPEVTTLDVEPAQGIAQRSVRDMRDANGSGSVTTTDLEYRNDGVYLMSLSISFQSGGITLTYEFDGDGGVLIASSNGGVGEVHEFQLEDDQRNVTVDARTEVLRTEQITIGGTKLDAFVVQTDATFSGSLEGEQRSTNHLSRAYSLTLREDVETDAKLGLTTVHSEQVSVLRSVTPA